MKPLQLPHSFKFITQHSSCHLYYIASPTDSINELQIYFHVHNQETTPLLRAGNTTIVINTNVIPNLSQDTLYLHLQAINQYHTHITTTEITH